MSERAAYILGQHLAWCGFWVGLGLFLGGVFQ